MSSVDRGMVVDRSEPAIVPTDSAPTDIPQPAAIRADDGHPLTIAGHVRIERYGNGKSRMFIDGKPFPWATSPEVDKVLTDVKGVMTDVTLAIRAHSAEIVDVN